MPADTRRRVDSPTNGAPGTVEGVIRTPIRAAVCRNFGEPLSIENLHLATPNSGQANGTVVIVGMPESGVTATIDPVTTAALNQSIPSSKMGTSTVSTAIPELAEMYRRGDLLLDELVTSTDSIDQIDEAIESVENGRAVRDVILFDHGDGQAT